MQCNVIRLISGTVWVCTLDEHPDNPEAHYLVRKSAS